MIEPTILNVQCQQCHLAWMLPLNDATYICPNCQYVGFERDLKGKADAIYNSHRTTENAGETE